MESLRTPDDRFDRLDDFAWVPQYADLAGGVRMAYVDEGPTDAPVVLMLHGEPTWGYLYRHMIGPVVDAGLRAVVPDLIGFGRSDKPAASEDYSYARHVDWVTELLDQLELREITLFCQDWGSLIGLRIAGLDPDRFARIVVGNGFLPAGQVSANLAFKGWRAFARYSPVFPIGRIVDIGTARRLTKAERAAYDAPFPSRRYLAGARAFPRLVPTSQDDPAMPANELAWAGLGRYERPFLTLFGRKDPILGKGDLPLQEHVPGAAGREHARLDGSHFVQEDCGPELARRIVELVRATG